MPIQSQYANSCKDCGIEYDVGDTIDTNGNKSPNTKGEIKDNWCKMGKNCQGAMQLGSGPGIVATEPKRSQAPASKEPSVEELHTRLGALSDLERCTEPYSTILHYVETRQACEKVGITLPVTIGMIWNNRIKRERHE